MDSPQNNISTCIQTTSPRICSSMEGSAMALGIGAEQICGSMCWQRGGHTVILYNFVFAPTSRGKLMQTLY